MGPQGCGQVPGKVKAQRLELRVRSQSSGWGASSSVPPAFHDQTAGITPQLSPRRAVGGMSGVTLRARSRFLVDENGTESGGVDAPIPVTEALTLQVTKVYQCWTAKVKFCGRVFGVRFRVPACGCRFGSGPGRFWCLCPSPLVGFPFGGVQLRKKKGHRPQNRQ